MTRRSRLSTPGLLTRHLRSGAIGSVLVAILIAASVLAVALAPRALVVLGTSELRHQLGTESPALLDLTGIGNLGLTDGQTSPTLDNMFGSSNDAIARIRERLPQPLRDHVGETQWVVTTTPGEATLPVQLPVAVSLGLSIDLDWQDRVHFVEGVAPAAWSGSAADTVLPTDRPPIEIAISTDVARQLQVRVGDMLGYRPAPLLVAGIYELNEVDDAYWVHESNLAKVLVDQEPGKITTLKASVYVDPLTIGGMAGTFAGGKLSAFLEFDPRAVDYAEVRTLQTQVLQLEAAHVPLPLFGDLNFRSGLPDAMGRVISRVTSASALLALCVSGLLGVLLAVFALGVQSIIDRRRPALALAAARGAGSLQLRSSTILEGVLISLPGSAIALGLATMLIPVEVGPEGWVMPALVALAPPVLFGVLTSPRTLRAPRTDLQVRSRSRARWVAELAVVGLAVLSLFLLARRGLVASSAIVGIDPLLAATPLLLAAAVCIGVLRLYPLPLIAVQRLLRRRRGSTGVLGAARAIRDPALGFVAALALVVGISIVVFSTVMATTLRAGLVQAAQDSVGGDVQIAAHVITPSIVDQVTAVDGVSAAVAVASTSDVELTIGSDPTNVYVVMADTTTLHAVRPDIPVLAEKVDGRIPLLVSSDWSDRVSGNTLALGARDAEKVGTISSSAIPGATRHYVLMDSAFASEVGTSASEPDRILVRLKAGVSAADIATQLDTLVTAAQPETVRGLVVVSDAESLLAATRASPTVASLDSALLLAALASLLLTMLSVVLASVAAATTRNRLVGVLRILGMSPRQLRAVQAWELGPVALTAVVVGTALGLVLPLIVTNALDLRPFVGGELQPTSVVDPLWVAAAVGAFVIVVFLAGVIAAALGRRFAPAGALKMGEG